MKLFSEPPLQPLKNKQLKEHKFTFSYHCINFLLPTVLKSFYIKSQPWGSNSVTTIRLRANATQTISNKNIFYPVSLFMTFKEFSCYFPFLLDKTSGMIFSAHG